jgi:hypothetical protein
VEKAERRREEQKALSVIFSDAGFKLILSGEGSYPHYMGTWRI